MAEAIEKCLALPGPIVAEVAKAIADDAEAIAALHDCELTPAIAGALRETGFPESLGLLPITEATQAAWRMMAEGIEQLPASADDRRAWDDLAAEYAAIYLTSAYGASPYESVWTDDDHLTCQGAMFELREIYRQAGLAAANWRQRADDHLVLQLLYIAHAARHAASVEDWRALAKVLDEHLLRWVGQFAARITERSSSLFYAGLANLTAAWLETVRDLLAHLVHEPRPSPAEIEERLLARRKRESEPKPVSFFPAAGGPSR